MFRVIVLKPCKILATRTAIHRLPLKSSSRRFSLLQFIPKKGGDATLVPYSKKHDVCRADRLRYLSSSAVDLQDPIILLDSKARPLGKFEWQDWEAGMAVIARQLEGIPARGDEQEKWMGVGLRLLEVEKILKRLKQEGATQSFVSRRFLGPDDLWSVLIATLQSWLDLSRAFPKTPIALVHAQICFDEVLSETRKLEEAAGHVKHDDRCKALLEGFLDLALAWCRLNTLQGINCAVDLLCSVPVVDLFQKDSHLVIPVYHDVLRESLAMVGAEKPSHKLWGHMENTATTFAGWENMRPTTEQIQKLLGDKDGALGAATSPDPGLAVRQIEHSPSFLQILSRVKEATKQDDEMVAEANKVLATLEVNELQMLLMMALTEYHVRINDVVNATMWLSRFDSLDLCGRLDVILDLLGKCIVLWIIRSESDPSAVYRAEELLTLLENISAKHEMPVDHRLYLVVAKAWLESGELGGIQKSLELTMRHTGAPDKELFNVMLLALQASSQAPEHILQRAQSWFEDLLGETASDEVKLVENAQSLMLALANNRRPKEANRILDLMLDRKLTVSPEAQKSVLACEQNQKNFADRVSKRLQYADPTAIPGIALCAIQALQSDLQGEHLGILNMILTSSALNGPDISGLPEVLMAAIEKLVEWDEPLFAFDVLRRLERENPKGQTIFPLPSSCYKKLIISLAHKGKGNEARDLFVRLRGGPYVAAFDSQFCLTYLYSLGGNLPWMERECDLTLKWLTEVYRSTGDLNFKPKVRMYTRMLKLWNDIAWNTTIDKRLIRELSDKATALLDEMMDLSAHEGDAQPFVDALSIALKCPMEDRFSRVHMIYQKVQATDGVEVNTEIINKMLWGCMSAQPLRDVSVQLKTAIAILGDARRNGVMTEKNYSIAFKAVDCLAHKNENIKQPLLIAMFENCCSDGFLSKRVREEVKPLLFADCWARVYTANLTGGEIEPLSWSRNIVRHEETVQNE